MPPVGSAQITAWMQKHGQGLTAAAGAAESARAGDLGYSYGSFSMTGAVPAAGAYVRVWQRTRAGQWLVMADVTQ